MDTRYTLQTSRRVAAPGARKIGRGNPNDLVHITIVLKSAVPIDKDSIRAEALKSRTQRRFLTPEEHAKNYGTSDDAISVVLAFAEKYHLHLIGNPDKVRRIVRLVGRRHAMEQAFGTQLDDYSLPNGEQYRGRVGALTSVMYTSAPTTAAIFGTNATVCSCTCVTACTSDMTSPPARAAASGGPPSFSTTSSVSRSIAPASPSAIVRSAFS